MPKRSSRTFPRTPGFAIDLSTDEKALKYAEFFTALAANIAGACMTDHLDDEGVIADMHDIIGALGAVQNTLQLITQRNNVRS